MTEKFIITSVNWEGEIMLEFDLNERLVGYKLNAELSDKQHEFFAQKFPISVKHANELLKAVPTLRAEHIPADLSFKMFWETYNYKVGNKARCEKLWEKISDAEKLQCLKSLKWYDMFLQFKKGIDKTYPETYLNQRRFETDYRKLIKG